MEDMLKQQVLHLLGLLLSWGKKPPKEMITTIGIELLKVKLLVQGERTQNQRDFPFCISLQFSTHPHNFPMTPVLPSIFFLFQPYNISNIFSAPMFHLDDQSAQQQATDPFQSSQPIIPKHQISKVSQDLQLMYYEQYKKIYLTSFKLWLEGRKQEEKQSEVVERVRQVEAQLTAFYRRKRADDIEEEHQQLQRVERKRSYKRNRRTAQQIQRKFQCPYEFCDRCYGSDGSLQQHLKLKHPELYRSISEDSYD